MAMSSTPVQIYTDGACIGNPEPGGYGVILLYGDHRKELSGGYEQTTSPLASDWASRFSENR